MRLLHALAFFLIAIPQEYCCFVITPIHRKMRYLKVHGNLKRVDCGKSKAKPAGRARWHGQGL